MWRYIGTPEARDGQWDASLVWSLKHLVGHSTWWCISLWNTESQMSWVLGLIHKVSSYDFIVAVMVLSCDSWPILLLDWFWMPDLLLLAPIRHLPENLSLIALWGYSHEKYKMQGQVCSSEPDPRKLPCPEVFRMLPPKTYNLEMETALCSEEGMLERVKICS